MDIKNGEKTMTKEELIEKIAMIVKCDKSRTCIDNTACYVCEDALERSRKIITIIESEAMHGTIIGELEKMQKWYDDALDWRESEIAKAVIAERERIINAVEEQFSTWRGWKYMQQTCLNYEEWEHFKISLKEK